MSFKFEYHNINDELNERVKKNFLLMSEGVVEVYSGRWRFGAKYIQNAHYVHNFEFRHGDVVVTSFPKSGTTWTQEIVWNMIHNPDQNNEDATISIEIRSPDFEFATGSPLVGKLRPENIEGERAIFEQLNPGCTKGVSSDDASKMYFEIYAKMHSPRIFKTHHPIPLLPENLLEITKVIYIARNLYDTANSIYHFARMYNKWGFTGTRDDFIELFVADRFPYCPYFSQMKEAWDRRHHPNLLFIFYEDLKKDYIKGLHQINDFLGTNRTNQQIEAIAKFTSFSALKERSKDNPPTSFNRQYFKKASNETEKPEFFRKGEVGDWKNYFNETQKAKLDAYAAKYLKNFGNDFKYKQLEYGYHES